MCTQSSVNFVNFLFIFGRHILSVNNSVNHQRLNHSLINVFGAQNDMVLPSLWDFPVIPVRWREYYFPSLIYDIHLIGSFPNRMLVGFCEKVCLKLCFPLSSFQLPLPRAVLSNAIATIHMWLPKFKLTLIKMKNLAPQPY